AHEAIFAALERQAEQVVERAARVAEAESARAAALEEVMKDSTSAPLLEEFEQFRDHVEPTLSALPESYRSALLQHHEQVVARLREHIARAGGGPVVLEAEVVGLDLVYAVDAPDGPAELLMVVLPL